MRYAEGDGAAHDLVEAPPLSPAYGTAWDDRRRFERERGIAGEIRDILAILVANWWVVALVTGAVVLAALFYIWTASVLYTSRVELLIDPRGRQTVESEVTPTGLGSSAAGADTLLLESQVEILRSQGVLDELIRSQNLEGDPEFAGGGGGGLANLVKTVIYGPQIGHYTAQTAYDRTVRKLRERISVERQRNTYVIAVTVQTADPAKSARLANALADIYVADVNDAASKSTGEAAGALSTKLDEMRASLSRAASAVEDYKRRNNLIGTREATLVEQRLADINRELSRVRAEVQTARARLNQLRAAGENGASGEGGAAESAVVAQLRTRLDETESALAEQRLVYADRHPILRRTRERRTALRAALRREFARIVDRAEVELRTASERAAALEAELGEVEGRMAASNASSVELRELEREAASIRAVYEGFLRRSKEAQEQVDLPSSTARVISYAYPSSRPSDPPALLLLAGAVGLGLSVGTVGAFLRHGFAVSRARHPERDDEFLYDDEEEWDEDDADDWPDEDAPRDRWREARPAAAPHHAAARRGGRWRGEDEDDLEYL